MDVVLWAISLKRCQDAAQLSLLVSLTTDFVGICFFVSQIINKTTVCLFKCLFEFSYLCVLLNFSGTDDRLKWVKVRVFIPQRH